MGTVFIYSDLNKNFQGKYDILIKRIDDYVEGYSAIKQAIYDGREMVVLVQNRYCLKYFQEMSTRYGNNLIKIIENSPLKTLSEKLDVEIPSYVTDEDIVADQIMLEIDQLHFIKGMSFTDIILQNYLGVYFTYEKFPFLKLKEFLMDLNVAKFKKKLDKKIVRKVYKNKLESWFSYCKEEYEKKIIKSFVDDPKQFLYTFCKYLILSGYPNELGKDILGDIFADFKKLKLRNAPFLIEGLNTIEIRRNLKVHLNQLNKYNLSLENIKKHITMVSGLFQEEFEFILEVIQKNINHVDTNLLDEIKDKFNLLLDKHSEFNEKINNILPPPFPDEPSDEFTLDSWLDWALKQYLPYKFWLEENDAYNLTMDEYASQYGDWIFKNYHQLLATEAKMLHKTLITLNKDLSKDEVSLIVMLDNYNFKYVPLVKEYFTGYGFNTTVEEPLISLIPTETSVSKSAFFNGEPYSTSNKSYEKRCNEWEEYFNKKVKYISDISKLDEIKENQADIYIFNYISIDKILHESQSNSALPISYRIQEEIKAMINKLIQFAKRIGYENEIKIYFTSDHGSTKIFPDQLNLIDSKYYKGKTEDAAHRYIALKDKQFKAYKDSIGQLCYVMDKNHYGTNENYLIARNYYRFINTDGSFYVHGGITPEEHIIPLLKFEKTSANLKKPNLILRTDEFRYSILSKIKFNLKNYNEYELKNVEIKILNNNIRWDHQSLKIGDIKGESELPIEINDIRIMKAKENTKSIMIRLIYFFLGKKYETDYDFNINIKSIQENKMDLDDLF